jgi:hypothetical protein
MLGTIWFSSRLNSREPSLFTNCLITSAERMSNVESWCTVELTSDQSHNRKQRKHHPDQFKSTVFQVWIALNPPSEFLRGNSGSGRTDDCALTYRHVHTLRVGLSLSVRLLCENFSPALRMVLDDLKGWLVLMFPNQSLPKRNISRTNVSGRRRYS